MKNLIKSKTHKKILLGVIMIISLIVIVRLFAIAGNGNFILADISSRFSNNTEPVSDKRTVTVQTKKIFLENVVQSIFTSAVTKPSNQANVSPNMTGKVVDVYFKEGDWVSAGQTIIGLEQDQILRVSYNNAQTNLINTRASMNQDIKTAEIAIEAAKSVLENTKVSSQENIKNAELLIKSAEVRLNSAEESLGNAHITNEQAITDAYISALNTSRNAILTGVNALVSLTDVQCKYMLSNDQPGIRVAEKKADAIYALLGQSDAGQYRSQYIGSLNKGVKGQVEEAISCSTNEKIDQILIDIVPAMQKVRYALGELRPNMDWKQATSTEKTIIDTARAGVESSITALSASEQVIINAKLRETTGNDMVRSSYDAAKTGLEQANQGLVSTKVQSESQIEAAGKQLESVEANLTSIKKKAELHIASAQGQVDSAQARLDNTKIVAPISGVISQKYIEKGEIAIAGNPVVNIVNINGIKIELFLTEFDIGKIFIEQEAEVSLAAYPNEKFIGEICYVGVVANTVSKKFPVKIQLDNKDGKIKAGMVAEIKIIIKKQENVLVIPRTSVFTEDGIQKVYTVENSIVKIKSVKKEIINNSKLKITQGLIEGEEVIIEGNYNLNNKDLVNIL